VGIDFSYVDVDHGRLAVHDLSPNARASAPAVVAMHGITANALAWLAVARELGREVRLLAPDLAGRAASRDVARPGGLARHVDDLVAVLDAFGIDRAVVAGHSMGAFVTALAATRRPDRVSAAVLVDGGIGWDLPPDADVDAVLDDVVGPALRRLQMRFDSPLACLAFWREHPALRAVWGTAAEPDLDAYIRHDLIREGDQWRSSCRSEVIRADGADIFRDPEVLGAAAALPVPATLLWAARGMLDEPQGLYDEARIGWARLPPHVDVHRIDDTNHYTIVLLPQGARPVAAAIRRAVERASS
jgi:pimeloyl-ACP methyl ester carboxylesterase